MGAAKIVLVVKKREEVRLCERRNAAVALKLGAKRQPVVVQLYDNVD